MSMRSSVRWLLLALAGLAVALAVALAASKLVSQRIGLVSEPLRAGESLAPAAADSAPHRREPRQNGSKSGGDDGPATQPATTGSAPTPATTGPAPAPTSVPNEGSEPTTAAGEDAESGAEDD